VIKVTGAETGHDSVVALKLLYFITFITRRNY